MHLGYGIVIPGTHDPFRDALDSCDLDPAHERGFCAHVNRLVSLDCGASITCKIRTNGRDLTKKKGSLGNLVCFKTCNLDLRNSL